MSIAIRTDDPKVPATMARSDDRASRYDFTDYGPPGRSAWQGIDWREHLRWVCVDGRRVNVVDLGEGDPVVFVHGLGANWQSWLEQLPHVAETGRRAIALDLPGFGRSAPPVGEASISGYGRAVAAVLEQLGLERAGIVGNSMGGFVAVEVALNTPELVDRLVLVSAAALWNERLVARPAAVASKLARVYGPLLAGRREFLAKRRRLRVEGLRSAGFRHPERIPAALAYELMSGTGAPGFADAVQALYDYRIRDRLSEVEAPTLVVWGTNDPLVPLWHAFEYEELIPQARVVVFRDTGHVPMLERPRRFNAVLDDFLAGRAELGEAREPAAEVR
jgi:pimeloyl-ACP methyl ester carboxylesterase